MKKIIAILVILLVVIVLGVLLFIQANKKALPQEDTFYFATYQNIPILFYKYEGILDYNGKPIAPNIGMYVPYEDKVKPEEMMMNVGYVDFQKLQDPQRLFTFDRYATIENIMQSNDKIFLAISLIGGSNDSTNYIYQVNIKTHEGKKIWEHEQRTGGSPYNGGFPYIIQFIPNRFVVFEFIKQNTLPLELPAGVVIKNIQTGNEKVLGVVGNIQINLKKNTISYKSVSKVKVPCEKPRDPVCFVGDTYKNAYESTGSIHTQPLP